MTGDKDDVRQRMKALLPPWFGQPSSILDAVLNGVAANLAWAYSLLQYVRAQTRIKTASDGWLDLIGWDFFSTRFTRRPGETDASWSSRIVPEVLRPRNTRAAILRMLKDLTGRDGSVLEPWNTGDCGAYGIFTTAYGVAGVYGSILMHDQVFVTAYRPLGAGIPVISGYGGVGGGYGVGLDYYVDISQIVGPVTDAEIYQRTHEVVASGVTAWEQILS